mgnify:CR=1 FL=1|tara:strand:- start:10247 stop:10627 length:381 start_codon:yes stop_codon:yes gene_type:complete
MIKTKESDNRATPRWLLEVFEGWFDPCPLNPNPITDGLEIEWKDKTYVNPPYSKPLPWIEKAIEENKKGKRIALLLRIDPSTRWYRSLMAAGAHFFYSGERIAFTTPEGITQKSNRTSMLVILQKP